MRPNLLSTIGMLVAFLLAGVTITSLTLHPTPSVSVSQTIASTKTQTATTTSMISVLTTQFITATSVSTTTTTLSTETTTTTTTLTQTVIRFPNVPFANPIFMEPPVGPDGACSGSSCWGGNFSAAILFDCPNGATQGCTVQLYNSWVKANFSIVASSFPVVGQPNEPNWANCYWRSYVLSPVAGVPPQPEFSGPMFGYCVPIGSAFIISMPGYFT